MSPIRVLVADGHALVRASTRRILEQQPDIAVVGEAADGLCAVATASRLRPDVAILDFDLSGLNGLQATRLIRQRAPATALLILSAECYDEYAVHLLEAGASGVLLKTVRPNELVQGVRRVHCGGIVLHFAMAKGRLFTNQALQGGRE